jgi:hypothetical protein
VVGLAVQASTQTPSIATNEQPKLVLQALPLPDLFHINEASLGSAKANGAIAEFERECQLLLLALLAQLLLGYMRDTRLKRRPGPYRGRGRGRSQGQDQGQCSPASLGAAVVGVEAQQVNLF